MTRLRAALRRWWHAHVVADDETSRRLDALETAQRLREGKQP